MARIDGIRKHVGEMDIKTFHALYIKNKWKAQGASQDSPDVDDNYDDEAHISYFSESD